MEEKAIFDNLCPNCDGEINDVRLRIKNPCPSCLPAEIVLDDFFKLVEEVYAHLKDPRGYETIHRVISGLREFSEFFEKLVGNKPWSAQRTWAKRLFLGKSFSIVAPTGVGKSLFGVVFGLFLTERRRKVYIVVPTSTLVNQTYQRARELLDKDYIVAFHSGLSKKEKEEAMERIREGKFRMLITTSQFLARRFELLEDKRFDLVYVDDVDAFLKASRNIDRVLKLLGFTEEIIEMAYQVVLEKIRLLRGRGDPKKIEALTKKIEAFKRRRKLGQLVVASATGRARGLRVKLFRELLDFEVGSSRANLRNVVNAYTELSDDGFAELIEKLGTGGIVFVATVYGEEKAKELVELLKERGIRAEFGGGSKAVKALERFAAGEVDVLVGSAYYYGTLVRGIDLPERVRYTVFYGVPRFRFGLDLEGITPGRLAFLLDILYDVVGDSKLRVLANRLRRYGREEDVEEGRRIARELLSRREVIEKLKEHPDIIIEEEEGDLRIIIPDYKTYVQGSGRASRMYAGGITKGLSVLLVDHWKAFEMLRRIMFNLYNEEFLPLEEIDLEKLLKEIDEDRKRVREAGRWEDPVKTVLFIVESPNKARTIARFFGKPSVYRLGTIRSYEVATGKYILNVVATRGHMYDLVVDRGFHGVLVNHRIIPIYTTIKVCRKCGTQTTLNVCPRCGTDEYLEDAKDRANALRVLSLEVDSVIIGTDPDTEGEKIAWDVYLTVSPYVAEIHRAEFHEVTRNAILQALEELRDINENRVDAQIVRRIEDRWIGFELSQKLWAVFKNRNLSAGRVQTPVLGWIIQRYEEHKRNIAVFLSVLWDGQRTVFETPFKSLNEAEEYGKSGKVRVRLLERRKEERNPQPPFTTDTMIREAGNRYNFGAKYIMDLAQDLFEAGLITYHRTDSTRVSPVGIALAREYISSKYGEEYFHGRSWGEGGAHEAIRPTRALDTETLIRYIREGEIVVEGLGRDHFRLYDLIFKRFIKSQMKAAEVVIGRYEIALEALKEEEERIIEIIFPGWMIVDGVKPEPLPEGVFDVKEVRAFKASKVPLYTQSDVVALMKERGIGRPSTYATIIQKLLERRYVMESKAKRKLYPTQLGIQVYNYLISKFPDLVSEERTRMLEKIMEEIEEGKRDYQEVLRELYREILSTRGII
ncbi:MAG: reverse gyrase [Candidatus Diapherotrites archaeon]|nr:reverse gyrase [Candidatus Diapherotrites archaeon]